MFAPIDDPKLEHIFGVTSGLPRTGKTTNSTGRKKHQQFRRRSLHSVNLLIVSGVLYEKKNESGIHSSSQIPTARFCGISVGMAQITVKNLSADRVAALLQGDALARLIDVMVEALTVSRVACARFRYLRVLHMSS